jgi:hypothetical protein
MTEDWANRSSLNFVRRCDCDKPRAGGTVEPQQRRDEVEAREVPTLEAQTATQSSVASGGSQRRMRSAVTYSPLWLQQQPVLPEYKSEVLPPR